MNLRQYAKGKPCMVRLGGICNQNPETTVLAHVRIAGITGGAQKAPDLLGAWCCSDCHSWVDGHKENTRTQRDFLEGVMRTQFRLLQDGVISG